MISLKRCRQILAPAVQLSDDELERVREDLYVLARVVVDIAARRKVRPASTEEREDRAA